MTLGSYIRAKRKEHGLQMTQLAQELGVSLSLMHDFEKGRRQAVRFLPALAQILQLDLDYLYYLAGRWPPDLTLTEEQVNSICALLRGNHEHVVSVSA